MCGVFECALGVRDHACEFSRTRTKKLSRLEAMAGIDSTGGVAPAVVVAAVVVAVPVVVDVAAAVVELWFLSNIDLFQAENKQKFKSI